MDEDREMSYGGFVIGLVLLALDVYHTVKYPGEADGYVLTLAAVSIILLSVRLYRRG